jgi:hypothetical protein
MATNTFEPVDSGDWNMSVTSINTSAGSVYTVAPDYSINSIQGSPSWDTNIYSATTFAAGDAEFRGDITVQGRSLKDFMDSVEQRLNILRPDPVLEAEWNQLRELGQRYRELEAELNEKSAMWTALGKTTPPVDK